MTEAVILSVVGKLETLLVEKAAVGAEELVEGLRDDLRLTLSFLTAGRKQDVDWICSVNEMAHDVDVAIDTFIFNLESSTRSRRPQSFQKYLENFHKQMGRIQLKLQNTHESRSKGAESPTRSCSPPPSRNRFLFHRLLLRPSEVGGLNKDVELLLRETILPEAAQGLAISCIVGMGGVGKTTLAGLLYDHQRVVSEFELRGWVYGSIEFKPKQILRELLLNMGMIWEPEMKTWDEHIFQEVLFEHLQEKRYFVVLDGFYANTDLEFVLSSFPDDDNASRLLLTSRTRNIIEHPHYIHEMNILDPKESWQLFLKRVFGEYTECPEHLENVARKIVKKCNGLPLAIIDAGNQLSSKDTESDWERFIESMDLRYTTTTLKYSYRNLPPKLRSFFLCLGFFKEDITVRVDKWTQIWTTGEMVPKGEERNETDEEIGRRYLDELINQFMVEVTDRSNSDYRVKNCHINANYHRLAVKIAKEELLFEVLRNNRPSHKRHRAICCSRDKFNYFTYSYRDKQVVSLFFHGGGNFDAWPSYWKSFELLKILDMEGFGMKILPGGIGKLFSLKYLGLRNNFLKKLPRSLGRLKKLEVLDIMQNVMVEVPDVIWEMDRLCHLYMTDIICRKPLKIDALKNLQTLTYISVDNWTYELSGLQMMDGLRKLGIEELDGNTDIGKMLASLAKLESLDCLILRGFRFRSMPSLNELGILLRLTQLKLDGLLAKLPSVDNFPPNIRCLTLINTSLDEDPMPVLGKLSHLLYLKLGNAYTGREMMVSGCQFAELEVLCIGELRNLRTLQVGEGAMPKLKRLEINSCPFVETLPQEIGSMANLKELKMVTTRGIARKISKLALISKLRHVDIQP